MTTTQAPPNLITITIDGQDVSVPRGTTILEAAKVAGIYIPTLCWDPRLKAYGACRMCVVQPEGRRQFLAACVTPADPTPGGPQVIRTNTQEVIDLRKGVLGLLMGEHPHGCLTCDRITHCGPTDICLRNVTVNDRCVICPQNQRCELQAVVEITGVDESIYQYGYRTIPVRTEDPYFDRDYNLCIACVRCVRVCNEVIGADAISMVQRGDRVLPGTPFDVPLSDPASGCIFCGACVDACPVGALSERDNKWAGLPERTVTTACTQCEIGCQVTLEVKDGKILRVVADLDGGANGGLSCIKGKFQLTDQTRREDRILRPIIRRNGAQEDASWDDALATLAEALNTHKGDAFALLTTGTPSNEDAYLLQKLARQVQGSANIDNLPRALSPAIAELAQAFGTGTSTNELKEIAKSKAILYLGADLNVTHPVAAYQIHKAANYVDAELITVAPEVYPELDRAATQPTRITRGTDLAFLRGMLKVILDEGLIDEEYVEQRTEGLEALQASVSGIDLATVARETAISAEDIQKAARTYATVKPASILYAVDPAVESIGIAAALANLALITGNVGKTSTGVHIFRPDGNAQGAQDMGVAPRDGERDLDAILNGIDSGEIKALLWAGDIASPNSFTPESLENRLRNDIPQSLLDRLARVLPKLDFLAVASLAPSLLTEQANVVLPAASFLERDGTYTNAERRVQRIRTGLEANGEGRPVWETIRDVAQRLDADGFAYDDVGAVFAEIARETSDYAGLSYDRLEAEFTGIQWPVRNAEHAGTPMLHEEAFATFNGRGRLVAV